MDKKASGKALLPFGIFVGIYLATGMILNFQGVEMAFYQLPAPVAAILGIRLPLPCFPARWMKARYLPDRMRQRRNYDHVYDLSVCRCICYRFQCDGRGRFGGKPGYVRDAAAVYCSRCLCHLGIYCAGNRNLGRYCDSYDTDYHWLGRSWWN